jgi:hypothetical protein
VGDVTSETEQAATPPALTLSIILGVIGAVVLLVAIITGWTALFVAAAGAGAASLIAALYWRSQLITDWRDAQGRVRPPGGIQ